MLYSQDFGGGDEVANMLMVQLAVTKKSVRQAQELMGQIVEKKEALDAVIRLHAQEYEFDRIPRVERNVIRLGVYELLFAKQIPPKVAIAEAIRLSRKFATPEAAHFVNAVLDSVYKQVFSQAVREDSHVGTVSAI